VGYFHSYKDGVDYVFVDHPCYHNRGKDIYAGERQDIQFRCALLCKAALEAVWHVPCGGVIYGDDNLCFIANDWHTALLPVYLQVRARGCGCVGGGGAAAGPGRSCSRPGPLLGCGCRLDPHPPLPPGVQQRRLAQRPPWPGPPPAAPLTPPAATAWPPQAHYRDYNKMTYARCLFVIHNMAHQGRGPMSDTANLELSDHYRDMFLLDDPMGGEHMNILKAGLQLSHRLVAVSHGYAWECTTPVSAPPLRALRLHRPWLQ
jgi:glycogen synthase